MEEKKCSNVATAISLHVGKVSHVADPLLAIHQMGQTVKRTNTKWELWQETPLATNHAQTKHPRSFTRPCLEKARIQDTNTTEYTVITLH